MISEFLEGAKTLPNSRAKAIRLLPLLKRLEERLEEREV
jgi:hypothetical protein